MNKDDFQSTCYQIGEDKNINATLGCKTVGKPALLHPTSGSMAGTTSTQGNMTMSIKI